MLIFSLHVEKRLGWRLVAKWLNDNGHRTKNGKLWSHQTVYQVPRNPVYAGRIVFQGVAYDPMHEPIVDALTSTPRSGSWTSAARIAGSAGRTAPTTC